jgi:hypothetical protein
MRLLVLTRLQTRDLNFTFYLCCFLLFGIKFVSIVPRFPFSLRKKSDIVVSDIAVTYEEAVGFLCPIPSKFLHIFINSVGECICVSWQWKRIELWKILLKWAWHGVQGGGDNWGCHESGWPGLTCIWVGWHTLAWTNLFSTSYRLLATWEKTGIMPGLDPGPALGLPGCVISPRSGAVSDSFSLAILLRQEFTKPSMYLEHQRPNSWT